MQLRGIRRISIPLIRNLIRNLIRHLIRHLIRRLIRHLIPSGIASTKAEADRNGRAPQQLALGGRCLLGRHRQQHLHGHVHHPYVVSGRLAGPACLADLESS